MENEQKTVKDYTSSFNKLIADYHVCPGATHLVTVNISGIGSNESTYDSLRQNMEETISAMQKNKPNANFAILLLRSRNIPAYCAFKDLVDREFSMQSLCLTQAPNQGKSDISQYMANIMMKANLKLGGGNHTVMLSGVSGSNIANKLQGTLVLGADVTHPGSNSLIGCPSIAAVVGSIDSAATKFRGSMRLQNTCKKEVRACTELTRHPTNRNVDHRRSREHGRRAH
jgi:eukaryotic translation initiation factor 2C